jgi:hypothetical protein
MTKKHFIKLAEAIATITDDRQRHEVANLIGSVCAESNDLFNWYTWLVACNIGE